MISKKKGKDNSSDCWVGESLHPTHRRCAMDGAPVFVVAVRRRNKDSSQISFGDDKKKAKATGRLLLKIVSVCPLVEDEVFAGRLLFRDEGKALDGDLCAAARTFPGG
jgi:hypothetical protein